MVNGAPRDSGGIAAVGPRRQVAAISLPLSPAQVAGASERRNRAPADDNDRDRTLWLRPWRPGHARPDRQYPGVLIQGDDLLGHCYRISVVLSEARGKLPDPVIRELEFLQEDLFDLLDGYTKVAGYPGIGTPPEKS